MTTTITKGAETTTPYIVTGFEQTRTVRTVLHPVIGRATPEVTLRQAAPRSGTLTLFYRDLASAQACQALHTDNVAPLTLTDDLYGTLRYVAAGDVALAVEVPGKVWSVSVAFQEVPL